MTGPRIAVWKRVLDQLRSGEMPPKGALQPSSELRQMAATAIKDSLSKIGETVDEGKWLHPTRGNWVDHDALFSGKPATATATRGRLWRLTGKAYEEFIQQLHSTYRLGFKTYGHSRIRAPWQLSAQEGFRDYASAHRIGEPEIEHHLRNATRVARAMIAIQSKRNGIDELKLLLKAGKNATREQIQAAADAAFDGILAHKPTKEESKRYTGFLHKSMQNLKTEQAVEQLLIAILFHPEVMYRLELPVDGQQRGILAPRHLARAIAFALTDREPDEELLAAAASGKLSERAEIRKQVERILDDDAIGRPRILRFFREYFGYPAAIDIFKDSDTRKAAGFRGKNDWHPNFFVSDADRLIESIVAADDNVLYELLTTSKTFTVTGNTKQASGVKKNATKPFSLFAQTALNIYEIDIKRKDWSGERAFQMPKEHRMGILTHPAWLIAHSTNFDNHAIQRGRWIRERLLGGRIPELPVTVDAQLPDAPNKTLRQRMHVTRDAYCWKCHREMDPLGLPFEIYDHFGQYRESELKKPVDANGLIERSGDAKLDGEVDDALDLMQKLASSDRVRQVFVRHVFRYFLGRNETLADGPTLVESHRVYVKSKGSMKALLTSLLTSDAFLYRTREGADKRERKTARRKP
jgi:hypothetical protein